KDHAAARTDNATTKIVEDRIDQGDRIAVLVDNGKERRVTMLRHRHRYQIIDAAMEIDPRPQLSYAIIRYLHFTGWSAHARVTNIAVAIGIGLPRCLGHHVIAFD